MTTKPTFNPFSGKFDYVSNLSDYQTLVDTPVAGDLASVDTNGQVVDSGYKVNDAGTATTDILSASQVLSRISNLPVGVGTGISLYLTATTAGVGSYDLMTKTPDTATEVIETAICTGGGAGTYGTPVLIDGYLASQAIASTTLNAGGWTFNLYGSVSSSTSLSAFQVDVYKYSALAVETLLFSVTSGEINGTAAVLTSVETIQPAFTVATTDKLLFKIYAKTQGTGTRTISLYHSGTEHYSHTHTPIVQSHNDLIGLQGGASTEYYHLTSAERTKATQNASTTLTGLLSSTDWNTFNSKVSASSISDTSITSKLLTNFVSGAGAVAPTDSILQAIQKLNGNIAAAGGGGGTTTTISYQASSSSFPTSPSVGDELLVTSDGTSLGGLKENWVYTTSGWYQLSGASPVSGSIIDKTIADSDLITTVGRYIVPSSGTSNLFVGQENKYADYDGTTFTFESPVNNDRVLIVSGSATGQTWLYSSSVWAQVVSSALSTYNWTLASSYAATNIVVYKNTLYQANGAIPANTAFAEGTTGATWKLIGAYNAPQFNPAILLFGAFA